MKLIKKISFIFLIINTITLTSVKAVPDSFADLAEKLMPSVVNISTTQTVKTTSNQFPFEFPPGSPFEEMFKDFQRPTERKASSLGSGFIIKEKRGVNGFGYDPYFIPKYSNKTFAEMEKSQKLLNSHRYKAFEKLSTQILQDN